MVTNQKYWVFYHIGQLSPFLTFTLARYNSLDTHQVWKDTILRKEEFPKFKGARRGPTADKAGDMVENSVKWVETVVENVETELSFAGNWVSKMLSIRNLDMMYKLQWRIFWLTIVVLMVAILAAWIAWSASSGNIPPSLPE